MTRGDEHGRAGTGNTDETDLPVERETDDRDNDEGRNTLHNGTERVTGKTVDLLRIVAEHRRELTGVVIFLVETRCPGEGSSGTKAEQFFYQLSSRRREQEVLEANGNHREQRDAVSLRPLEKMIPYEG